MGLWLAQASEQHMLGETIEHLIHRNCDVSLHLLDPAMSDTSMQAVAAALGMEPTEVRERARISLSKIVELAARLPVDAAGQLSIYTHSLPIAYSFIEFDWGTEDHRIWWDIKIRGRGRSDRCTLSVGGREFDQSELLQTLSASIRTISASGSKVHVGAAARAERTLEDQG